jgi:twitching motility protein PilT
VMADICSLERGLVLVTGVTGSGKSSTQAAMVGYMNRTMRRHIVTLENPIEFLHRDDNSSITQREVGQDTESFKVGLRAALRQDPDVILIGEMRDSESIDIALKAAETGHLVISTVHTRDAASTISRLVASFPKGEHDMVRMRLSDGLQAIVSQRLLPTVDGGGRALAAEVMIATAAIQDCIADPERVGEIREHMAEGKVTYGMQTFDQALMELVHAGRVDFAIAKAAATNPSDFDLKMNMLSGTSYGAVNY